MSSSQKTSPEMSTESATLFHLAIVAALVLFAVYGLWGYGIWDPWEVAIADAARKLSEGQASGGPDLNLRLVGLGFNLFGTREWAGRLPMALCGLALFGVTYPWVRRFSDASTALYALIALGTTPFFLMHSREMVGATPTFLAATLVMLGASGLSFAPAADAPRSSPWPFAIALALGLGLGISAAGALLAIAPPLVAVAAVSWLVPRATDSAEAPDPKARIAVGALAGVVLASVVWTLLAHRATPNMWVGTAPIDAPLSTYDRSISELFHAFAPWSAILPVALASAFRSDEGAARELPLRLVCVLWAALAYAAQNVFLSSFGPAAFPAPVALAVAVALWLRDRERDPRAFWPELAVIVLMVALIIRDFALYPSSPIEGLSIDAKAPEVFNPKSAWSLCIGGFGLAVIAACAAVPEQRVFDPRALYRSMRGLWDKGGGYRGWLVTLAGLVIYLLVFGILAWTIPKAVHFSSLVTRVGRVLLFVPLAIPLAIAAVQWAYAQAPQLAGERFLPVIIAAVAIGAYTSQRFMPELATHLSPRVVFDTYNRLAKSDEPLAQYRVQGRAAAYYAKGKVEDVANESALTDFLNQSTRHWAVIAADQLPDVDVAFRRRTGQHLFVASMENAKLTLLANKPVDGAKDLNPLTKFVVREAPKLEHTSHIDFDDSIELLGYNLELPRKDSVGPGQAFYITWVWRSKKAQTQPFQVFLHGDGPNERLNGDHDPVDGKYPVRLWSEGDIVVDRQRISVPATAPAGTYTLYVGLFHGETRAKVAAPANDGTNRAKVGTIRVQ